MIDRDFALVHYDLKESGIISFNPPLQVKKALGPEIRNASESEVVTSTVTTPRFACRGAIVAEN